VFGLVFFAVSSLRFVLLLLFFGGRRSFDYAFGVLRFGPVRFALRRRRGMFFALALMLFVFCCASFSCGFPFPCPFPACSFGSFR
jgi:hypothetical protein